MATGRTTINYARVYIDGYDLSGASRSIGGLKWGFDEADLTTITDPVKNALPGQATLGIGSLNGVFDNTATSGLHIVASGAGVQRVVMIPQGIRAAPAAGDPVYMGQFYQSSYQADPSGVYVNLDFAKTGTDAVTLAYVKPWGVLLHPNQAETAVNTAIGIDDNGAATAFGGYMVYHAFAGNGTATIKVQDAATNLNGSFADLSGCTSGVIDCATPKTGLVAIARTATVRQFLRWQVVLGTATTVTFALAFVRANY